MSAPDPSTDKTGAAAPFDFEAFIKGTQLPRRTVAVYRVDHSDEIKRLEQEHDDLPAPTTPVKGDERESDTGATSSARADIAARVAALRDEMRASKTLFEIRTLTPDELAECLEKEWTSYKQITVQSSSHGGWNSPNALTEDQWRQVADAIGTGQWGELMSAANALIDHKAAVPDFSPSISKTLAMRASFAN
jgi:hypothetical protein